MTRRFDHIGSPEARAFIVERLSDDALLGRGGYTMRQATYVLPYLPSQREYARDLVAAICAEDLPNRGVRPIHINLYDIVLGFLDQQDMWEPLCEAEQSASRDELIMMLQDTVSVSDVIRPAVEKRIIESGCDLAFISGVGETFPYVRTHTLLGELDSDKPVVLVFPGEYRQNTDGSTSLDILSIPSAANGGYYRATNVFDL
ncbi:MAG TPA: DUF1788 domain-containing protein [Collinsella ihuae]|uniref:DUF1788 domain-containing protein n=1 Tax=Collinsella ihumii TaxID=1720204 RepID=A0A921IPG1_9ACTN|nr:DUF1788 domain-containing protein [Collinsella ihumii]